MHKLIRRKQTPLQLSKMCNPNQVSFGSFRSTSSLSRLLGLSGAWQGGGLMCCKQPLLLHTHMYWSFMRRGDWHKLPLWTSAADWTPANTQWASIHAGSTVSLRTPTAERSANTRSTHTEQPLNAWDRYTPPLQQQKNKQRQKGVCTRRRLDTVHRQAWGSFIMNSSSKSFTFEGCIMILYTLLHACLRQENKHLKMWHLTFQSKV